MGMIVGHLPCMRTGGRCRDHILAPGFGNDLDDLGLGFPDVWVLNGERLASHQANDFLEASEYPGMSGARCSSANHLGTDRQIQTNDTVLVESDAIQIEHFRDSRPDGHI